MDKGMENKHVLIVGKHSYIGKRLAKELEKENVKVELIGAKNREWEQAKLAGYDSIVIAAAIVHKKEKEEEQELYKRVNLDMPIAIAKKAKAAGVKQVIFLSSMAVFGNQYKKISFDTKPNPETFYGTYKYQAELELRKLEEDNFSVAVVRPPMVYGENCPGNYGRLKKLAKYAIFFPDTKNKRSMIEAGRLAEYLSEIVFSGKGGIYHPQDAEYVNTAQMVKAMRSEIGKKTYLFTWMNWLLIPLSQKVGIIRKIFGNLYYEKE